MKKQKFGSVWDAIEDTPEAAINMKLRSQLMSRISEELKGRGLSQAEAAKILGVTQPRVSDLFRGRIDLFSMDALVNMLYALHFEVEITAQPIVA
jgi:predicted XRE-type DNA-binding protein